MKLHLRIEKRAALDRVIQEPTGDDDFVPVDDSFATFTINEMTYRSESPKNSGMAASINNQLEQLERATA